MASDKLTDDLDAGQLAVATKYIDALTHPLAPDDIRSAMALLPAEGDTAAGLNWSLLHAIEAAPDWPMWELLADRSNEWVRILRLRLANADIHPSTEDEWERGK
ncbi:hypothetical protein ACFQ1E_07035 [Sphingomonas canadensis]|uniref:Uncharacterized protein n=1 Tax=Sphingomonas canadensis TaxID=1219257 RepID=A0ABW3H8U1_9SPHN|nr:hypothetical protein [Sphingomonas canadensis]MCW3835458.1 hypothetical protein [Sphingomonas canadensis]